MAKQTRFSKKLTTDSATKFSLYLKTREIKEIGKALEHIMLLPRDERNRWIEDHGDFMSDSFDEFINRSSQTFDADNVQYDSEMLALSEDLVVSLQETCNRLQVILSEHQKLKS